MEINVRNVNQAFSEIFWHLKTLNLKPEETRNGPALVFPETVLTTYRYPCERVLFDKKRDANPVFHLMESIWMLAGRNDVSFLQQFNKRMVDFSDDTKVFNAAYGHRWRKHFGFDQIDEVIKLLRREPNSRQAVIQMWDSEDLHKKTKDKACNTQIVFDIHNNRLNMTVFNRSNDIWWGAYGANAVHFSFLQEFVAAALSMHVGVYRQMSNNLHLYTELYDIGNYLSVPPNAKEYDYYSNGAVRPKPILLNSEYKLFLFECELFCQDPFNERIRYANPFFWQVAHPLAMISKMRKTGAGDGKYYAAKIQADDWRRAAFEWIDRRDKKQRMLDDSAEMNKVNSILSSTYDRK
jgi:thymidylate synthase